MIFVYFSLFFDFIFLIFSLVLLLKKSPIKHANNFLAVTFLLMSFCGIWLFFLNYAIYNSSDVLLTYYYPVSLIIVMLIGPFIYFYLRILLGNEVSLKKIRIWVHFLPALPALGYVIYFITLPAQIRVNWLYSDYEKVRWQEYIINNIFYFQLFIYLISCYRLVNKQLKRTNTIEVRGKLIDISWLRVFFGIAIILFIIKAIICSWINSDRINTLFGLLLMDVLFLYFFINSVWETGLFTQNFEELPRNPQPAFKLTTVTADSYLDILLDIMEKDKIYLSSECTIESVADHCRIPRHHLSHILNTRLNKSFVDFINEYRIRHACMLIKDLTRRHLTLEALGQECGFGSKPSFNRAFKKYTGYTPTEYKQFPNVELK